MLKIHKLDKLSTDNDIENLSDLLFMFSKEDQALYNNPTVTYHNSFEEAKEQALRITNDEYNDVFIAKLGDIPVGFCLFSWYSNALFLKMFFVYPKYRRKGIGKELFEFALQQSDRDTFDFVLANTNIKEETNIYTKLGFVKQLYNPDKQITVYRLDLKNDKVGG